MTNQFVPFDSTNETLSDYKVRQREELEKLVKHFTDFVNTFSLNQEEFNQLMSMQHRTLQQSFTRLAVKWLEHCASDGYRTDLRNEGSKQAGEILKAVMEKIFEEKGFKLSDFLGMV
jgi:hypothetical protein